MGAWAFAAWDNDGAADWFAEHFEKSGLAKYVEATLQRPVEDDHEEIRSAISKLEAEAGRGLTSNASFIAAYGCGP